MSSSWQFSPEQFPSGIGIATNNDMPKRELVLTFRNRALFYLLFALSGFSGLIYESVWSHYMKLFLGHSAYAQTLVLSIFMAGLAIGSWLCSRYSASIQNLFTLYALAEAVIGAFAMIFHDAFDLIVTFSFTRVIPYMSTPETASIYQWVLSSLLILPQAILIGMPFPLMTAGLIRFNPITPGRTISMLYFTNTLGGAFGVLASSFILVKLMGLPGTIKVAGIINICLAVVVWLFIKDYAPAHSHVQDAQSGDRLSGRNCYALFLLASMITGAASFAYEIGWIRMLSLVLGSSTHAFELMLSAFIFGLAFGGLWIKKRIDGLANPAGALVVVQIAMGTFALFTLPMYGYTFDIMQWILGSVEKTDTGYLLFNFTSYTIALMVMLPSTFCAGMAIPLITVILLRQGHGERSIGIVYAANTVGAILGTLVAVHVGMPLLGLKGLITAGAGLDIGLGLALLWLFSSGRYPLRLKLGITTACACAVLTTALFIHLDPYKMASGVYRHGTSILTEKSRLLYHRDGKTATVSLSLSDGLMSLRTNGKVDAGINMLSEQGPTPDEVTMVLAAAIPLSLKPDAKTAANIGLGSGLTTHMLLLNDEIEHIDTVEIESCIVEAARMYGDRVEKAFADPRSSIHIDDAKSFFAVHNTKYDIIISEPSNPWVSGVSSLFTDEFYQSISRHLTKNGLFVQWMQLYEIDLSLVASVLKAVSARFDDFSIFAANNTNILIIARNHGFVGRPDTSALAIPGIKEALHRIHINSVQDIEVRQLGNKRLLKGLIESFPIRRNSDYYPVLDQYAAKSRFMKSDALELQTIAHNALPAAEMLMGPIAPYRTDATSVTPTPFFDKAEAVATAKALRDFFIHDDDRTETAETLDRYRDNVTQLKLLYKEARFRHEYAMRLEGLFEICCHMMAYLRPHEMEAFWQAFESLAGGNTIFPAEAAWISFFKSVGRRDAVTMARTAHNLLENSPGHPPHAARYLVAAGMLGYISQGDKATARHLWSDHGTGLFGSSDPGLPLRMLVANSY